MENWHYNQAVENLQDRINNPNLDARLIYDDPLYWSLYNKVTSFQESASLTNRISGLENKLDRTNQLLEMQTKEVHDLAKGFQALSTPSTNKRKHMYTDNSCCGAASDAWIPSYPQVEQPDATPTDTTPTDATPTDTTQATPFLHWQNRLRIRARILD